MTRDSTQPYLPGNRVMRAAQLKMTELCPDCGYDPQDPEYCPSCDNENCPCGVSVDDDVHMYPLPQGDQALRDIGY